MNEGQIAIVVSKDKVKRVRRWLDGKHYIGEIKVIEFTKGSIEDADMGDYKLALVCIRTFRDYIRGICIQKKFSRRRTVFIICSNIFADSLLEHLLRCRKARCKRIELMGVIAGILDMVAKKSLIDLNSNDFIEVCDSPGISCNYYIGKKEEVMQQICEDKVYHKKYRLLNIRGDVGLPDVVDICSIMGFTDDDRFGSGYVPGDPVKVFVMWQDE